MRQNAPSESNVVYRTTQLLREIVDNTGYTYTYDDVGNILTVKTSQRLYPNTSKVEIGEHSDYRSYSYDNKYQLTRENNVTSGKTTVYSYDELGNITSKTEYPYTQGALGTALSTVNYTYSNDGKNGWNKLLTAVGNETVTYDAIGNPTSYLGASLSWFGRKLQSYEKGNTSVTYTYDAGGSRASKTVNGTKSEFVYLDGKLVYEKRGGDDIFYLYDSYGNISNIRWYKNGASSPTNIYVITNRQGDVLGLYDYAGRRKVSYEYDAWGNTVSVTDTSQDNWSTLNPFRYRGYYFDSETGLYYCNSRYYNPEIGRWINADTQLNTVAGVLGYNLFAYCNNNPVKLTDPDGHFPFLAITAAIGAVAGAVIGGVRAAKSGKSVWKGALKGAAIGGLIGLGAGAAAGVLLAGSATATVASVVIGAKAVVSVAGSAGIVAGAKMLADNASQACSSVSQVFWSGGDVAKNAAKQVASDVGGKTLEMTRLGTYLEQIDAPYSAWQAASSNFANVASNSSSAIYSIQNAAGVGLQSTWATIEYPLLQGRDIIYGVASQSGSIQIMP